jgi:secondary thiamine-phosphate synthase enzyme
MTSFAEFSIHSKQQNQWINISSEVQKAIDASGVKEGLCAVFIPHTTAAVTINENADPDVTHDMSLALSAISPDRREFRHSEGNSAAHTKTTLVGPSITTGTLH